MAQEYNASSIKVLEFPESIRSRFSMYIGAAETAMEHLTREVLDNSIDEYLAGHNRKIIVSVSNAENFIQVEDFGRGIPIDDAEKFKQIFTSIHSGKILPL